MTAGAAPAPDTVAGVVHAVALTVLGQHPVGDDPRAGPSPETGPETTWWFDAVDVIVRTSAGDEVVLGLRTREYVDRVLAAGADPSWPGGYRPLPIEFDPAAVRHWDFGEVLWIGPADHPCLVWSNAEALSVRALVTMLGPDPVPARPGRLLAGPGGRGLPTPRQFGVTAPADAPWIPLALSE